MRKNSLPEMPALLSLAATAARRSADRQAVIAVNVANSDTPGFRAMDLIPPRPDGGGLVLRRTRAAHLGGPQDPLRQQEIAGLQADPNGNTVDLEDQVLRGLEAQRDHDRALTVYRSALDLLRASLGRR